MTLEKPTLINIDTRFVDQSQGFIGSYYYRGCFKISSLYEIELTLLGAIIIKTTPCLTADSPTFHHAPLNGMRAKLGVMRIGLVAWLMRLLRIHPKMTLVTESESLEMDAIPINPYPQSQCSLPGHLQQVLKSYCPWDHGTHQSLRR